LKKVSSEDLLLVGSVTRPHGLRGLLRIRSYAQSEKSFLNAGTVFLETASGETHEHAVSSISPHQRIFLLTLKGLDSLEEAEKYRGAAIFIRKDPASRETDDEYFWHEIIGMQVYLKSGEYIGTVEQVIPTGGNDVFVVRKEESEILIPGIHDVVREIDLEGKKMIIDAMEGMLELNEV